MPSFSEPKYQKSPGRLANLSLRRNRPILTNPLFLMDRDIKDIGVRFMDFLGKVYQHFSPPNAKKLNDPSARLIKYSTIEGENKIYEVALLAHDIDHDHKEKVCKWILEDTSATFAVYTNNLINIGWDAGTDSPANLLSLAEIITFLGPPEEYIYQGE